VMAAELGWTEAERLAELEKFTRDQSHDG